MTRHRRIYPFAYVIAEAGACGDANLDKMLAQIDACAKAGVSAVKFQWTSDATAMAKRRGRAFADGYADVYKRYLMWPEEWHYQLRERCDALGVDYICTVYMPKDVHVIDRHVSKFKVSSFEALDTELHSEVMAHCDDGDKRMILSTGMCSYEDIEMLSFVFASANCVDLLHCVSAYPTPFDAMNLSNIHFHDLDGYSDHTSPQLTWTGALAFAAGAHIIEAHMKLDTTDPSNPDAAHAMTPAQLSDYVQRIEVVEKSMYVIEADNQNESSPHVEDKMRPYRFGSNPVGVV